MGKNTLLSNAPHIIYDGLSSRMFGIINVQPSNGLAEEIFIARTNLVTDKSRYNDRTYLLGVEREPLEFSVRLLFDPHTFDERKLQDMKRWFYQDTYKPFRYDSAQEQDLDIWVYAIATGDSSAHHNAIDDGYIDFTFQTNAPYRFSQLMEDEFDFSITNTEKMLTEIKDGYSDTIKTQKKLISRLKQSVVSTKDLTNGYIISYNDSVKPISDQLKEDMKKIDIPYEQLEKVKGAQENYKETWLNIKENILSVLEDVDVSGLIGDDEDWETSSTNLYSKSMSTPNLKLELDGAIVYDESYITSDFIPVMGTQMNWNTHNPVPHIEIPRVVFYDKNKDYVEAILYDSGKEIVIDIPEGIEFIRVSAPINIVNNSVWKIEEGAIATGYTESPYDKFPALRTNNILKSIQDLNNLMNEMLDLEEQTNSYVSVIDETIDNTLDLYPDIVHLYNFGDLPCKPVIEMEIVEPSDIRIENLDTGESTTITDNIIGEKITLLNETEQIKTSRSAPYYKYDAHDENFITLRKYENTLRFYGSFKVKIIYQFKIL